MGKPQKSYLTKDERRRLKDMTSRWRVRTGKAAASSPNAVFHIGDDPAFTVSWTLHGKFPCFRRSMWRLWVASRNRFVTVKEKATALGFPVYSQLANCAGLQPIPAVTGICGHELLGNSMHVASVGVVALAALVSIRIHDNT